MKNARTIGVKNMQTATHTTQVTTSLPLPKAEKKRLVQAEINEELFRKVEKIIRKRNIKIRQAVEWGLEKFIFEAEKEKNGD